MDIKRIDTGHERSRILFQDDIAYAKAGEKELGLSLMCQAASSGERFPVVVWFNGSSWRGVDKNQHVPELVFLADAGYAVASVYYRSVFEGHFPDQVIDCKTAVRFLRKNAGRFSLDPERIAVMGRSAGGYLASFLATNTEIFAGDLYPGYSSKVKCAIDLFGPVDLTALLEEEERKSPGKSLLENPCGMLLGGERQTVYERSKLASVTSYVGNDMAPVLIAHGDADGLVPFKMSVDFANQIAALCGEDKVEMYLVEGAGHGDESFYQESFKKLLLDFLARRL